MNWEYLITIQRPPRQSESLTRSFGNEVTVGQILDIGGGQQARVVSIDEAAKPGERAGRLRAEPFRSRGYG